MAERQYSEEAAREILKRAVDQQVKEAEFTESQLLDMAQELGISRDALVLAQQSWLAERETTEDQRQYEADRRAFEKHRRSEWRTHLGVYLIVNTFLFLLNMVTSGPGEIWFIYPLLAWGIGLAIHGWTVYNTDEEELEDEFMKWRVKRNLKRKIYNRLSS